VVVGLVSFAHAQQPVVDVVEVSTAEELQRALAQPLTNTTIRLAPGEYHLTPTAGEDPTCGNCEDPAKAVPITVGQRVSGRSVSIEGPEGAGAVIYTNAGYGLLFEDCQSCKLENVTVTGGVRDESPEATDAGIVVRRSQLMVSDCVIRDNIGDPALLAKNVVGIIGICGREQSNVTVMRSRIIRNSWDGIALYRDASAHILNNVIDGVDRAGGKEAGGGRGVGIGATWNATARIENNLVRRYWKGIGVFVDARVQAVTNIVEEMTTWGIVCWDAGKGKPSAAIGGNVVYDCGACGVSITRTAPLGSDEYVSLTQNIIAKTGQNPKYDSPDSYCKQCALAEEAVPEGARIENNVFFDNRRASEDLPDHDVPEDSFQRSKPRVISRIIGPVDGYAARHVFMESTFMRQLGN